jgi:hypothetical protein
MFINMIFLLQETMCVENKVVDFLSSFLKYWTFFSINVEWFSSGFVTCWNTKFGPIYTMMLHVGVVVYLRAKEMGKTSKSFIYIGLVGKRILIERGQSYNWRGLNLTLNTR